ncbi:MAG: polyprenyl diphosphate synthase, partial [Stackebrandtia sp.]
MRSVWDIAYEVYERRVRRALPPERLPMHVGVIVDGNRRWARAFGTTSESGHAAGAEKIDEFLGWCDEIGVEVVTLWLLSTDNLARPARELDPLLRIIEKLVGTLANSGQWRVNPVGAPDLLPSRTAEILKAAAESTKDNDGMTVNTAVGYGGRRELADAVRSLL